MDSLSPWIAFTAGIVSIFSPCILPMIPVYLASLAGPEIFQSGVSGRRLHLFFHSLCFILGFTLIFVMLGTGVGMIGLTLSSHFSLIRQISGGLMLFFGLFMLAATKISWLNYERHLQPKGGIATGYLRSFVLGILFTLVWTPCAGPVLGSIASLALQSGSSWQGGALLAFYSLGIGLPFLIVGLAFDSVSPLLKRINRYSTLVYSAGGILLIALGILVLLNKLTLFSSLAVR
jgi:cytochrome c-type biogenesis protein